VPVKYRVGMPGYLEHVVGGLQESPSRRNLSRLLLAYNIAFVISFLVVPIAFAAQVLWFAPD
jgi:hypothetical protein